MRLKRFIIYLSIILLIFLEQGIKIVINANYLNQKLPILPPYLYFEPMFNRSYSWFNSMLQLGISKWIHILFVGILLIFIILFYIYILQQYGFNHLINTMFTFLISGALCSLIDKVFWNGSLDYILIEGFFTFDLKDVYIDIFIGLLILSFVTKNKIIEKMSQNNHNTKDFLKFILRKN
ncbi:MAG: signal peptidase [Anaerocolumna sp.]|jgi:signal peptidase II|nr:signal peptidase [Anaerocolumna sp.]